LKEQALDSILWRTRLGRGMDLSRHRLCNEWN